MEIETHLDYCEDLLRCPRRHPHLHKVIPMPVQKYYKNTLSVLLVVLDPVLLPPPFSFSLVQKLFVKLQSHASSKRDIRGQQRGHEECKTAEVSVELAVCG